MTWSHRLYNHWSYGVLALWGALALFVIPMWAIIRPTNYDLIIVMGMSIVTMVTWCYCYIVDEAESSNCISAGLKRIHDNKNLSSDEISKRSDMYRKMF